MESFIAYHRKRFDELISASDYITNTLKLKFKYFDIEETLTNKKSVCISRKEELYDIFDDNITPEEYTILKEKGKVYQMKTFKGLSIVSDTLFNITIGGNSFTPWLLKNNSSYFMYTNNIRLKDCIGVKYIPCSCSCSCSSSTLKQNAINAVKKEKDLPDKSICSEDLCDCIDYVEIMEKIPEKFRNGTWYRFFVFDNFLILSSQFSDFIIDFISENASYYISGFGTREIDNISYSKFGSKFYFIHTDGYQLAGTQLFGFLCGQKEVYDFMDIDNYNIIDFYEKGYSKDIYHIFLLFLKYQKKKGITIDPSKLYTHEFYEKNKMKHMTQIFHELK